MNDDGVNRGRRRFLTGATCVVGAAGVVGAAVPFVGSWNPSARAKAAGAPAKANISQIEAGAMITVAWRGKPVFIVNRTKQALESLDKVTDELRDPESKEPQQPDYVNPENRAIKPEYLVMIGICTHLGCVPLYKPEPGIDPGSGQKSDSWVGGFFCPCHGSKYDLAGRVFKDVPAPLNMVIPPYHYQSDNVVIIGVDPEGAA